MNNQIEKRIELKAPVSRVWRALTDYREFGQWFRVKLDGPFVPGQTACGQITYPGYEHVKWEAVVQKMEPERLFSFTWHPYFCRLQNRLLERDAHPCRIQAGEDLERHTASTHRVRLRQDPQRSPSGSVPEE
jgi:hypothetical protein